MTHKVSLDKPADFKCFRKRVGKYRILFVVNNKVVEIYKIGLRKNVYKK